MKIKYVWFDNPDVEKVYDTENGYREYLNLSNALHLQPKTKQEYDEFEKENFAEKQRKGLVLRYEIMEEKGDE